MTKIHPCALAALLLVIPNTLAFTSPSHNANGQINTSLNAGKNTDFDKIVTSAGVFFTGLVAATQIAFADPSTAIIDNDQGESMDNAVLKSPTRDFTHFQIN